MASLILLGGGLAVLGRAARRDVRRRRLEEEFIRTLQGADDEAEAQDLLRRHVERLVPGADEALAAVPSVPTGVTASFGVAALPEHARDADGLLRAADRALYSAKQAGRDRVELAAAAGAPVA